ncbi:MAG TPA: MFS transporter [Desulfomonilia bacterium]|nr:MFS transporter [Desulfomonilia bacterium]
MEQNTQTSISSYRWVVLVVFMVNVAITQILWLTYAPISRDVAAVYTRGNVDYIDFLSLLFMVVMIPLTIPSAWCIDRFGLKWGSGIGVIFLDLCGFLRIFSPDYTWLFIFTIGCSIGQPFLLNSITKVASNWFPEKEEVLASGLLTMSLFVGLVIAMFAPDLIISSYRSTGSLKQGIGVIHTLYGIASLAGMILFFAFVSDKPKIPPNPIAAEKKVSMTIGLKSIFRNRDFLLLLGSFFIGLGAFNAIMTKIDFLFKDRAMGIDSALVPGIMGGLLVVGGIFGAVILSALSDKFHRRKIFLVLAIGLSIPLTLLLQYSSNVWIIGTSSFIFGFFLVSAMPIGLMYAVDKTHPVPEATSNGILMLSGQITGIIFVIFFNMTMLSSLFGVALVFSLLMTEIDRKKVPNVTDYIQRRSSVSHG